MIKYFLVAALFFCAASSSAQMNKSQSTKYPVLQRIRIVKSPVKEEPALNAQVIALDARIQAAQASMQKAQEDLAALQAAQDKLKLQLDAMNEMSEETSMRLQMAMDRRSKFMETLSNILKKISDTQSSIVQNMK